MPPWLRRLVKDQVSAFFSIRGVQTATLYPFLRQSRGVVIKLLNLTSIASSAWGTPTLSPLATLRTSATSRASA